MGTVPSDARTFEFWLGRAGSGKTFRCIQDIGERLRAKPRGAPLLFLVPEQASAQMEYALACQPGVTGYTRARVLTFRLLEREVFSRVGGRPPRPVDEPTRIMILRSVLRRCQNLQVLVAASSLSDLAQSVSDSIQEFQRYGWKLEDLELRVEELEATTDQESVFLRKLRDLAIVWSGYQDFLRDRGFQDVSEVSEAAREGLSQWKALEGAHLWIDGFASFTAEEQSMLEALLVHVHRAAMTLCVDPESTAKNGAKSESKRPSLIRSGPKRIFGNNVDAYDRLGERLRVLGWHTRDMRFPRKGQPTRYSNSPALAHLERELVYDLRHPLEKNDSEIPASESWPDRAAELIEASSRKAEVEAAARRIARLCRTPATPIDGEGPIAGNSLRGLRWSETTVIVRDLETYAPLVREVFPKYGIPFFLDQRRSIRAHPIARLLLSCLHLCRESWTTESVLNYLKTGLSPGKNLDTISRIEKLAEQRRLRGDEWSDVAKWIALPRKDAREEAVQRDREEALELFAQWQKAASPVASLRRDFFGQEGADPAQALWNLLSELCVGETIANWIAAAREKGDQEDASIHYEAWSEAVRLLERLEEIGRPAVGTADSDELSDTSGDELSDDSGDDSAEEGASEREMTVNELYEIVETALTTVRAALIPPALEQVLVGSIERSRTPPVKAAFVLGLSEGEFPRVYEEDPMFGDHERDELRRDGSRLGPDSKEKYRQERFLAYIALTRASHLLVVSRPAKGEDGNALAPSSFFRAVEEILPDAPICTDDALDCRNLPILPIRWAGETIQALYHASAGEDPGALGEVLLGDHPLRSNFLARPEHERERSEIEMAFAALDWPREAAIEPSVSTSYWKQQKTLPVTALETYAQCPYRFFAERVMRFDRPTDPMPGPMELGQLRHEILEVLFERLKTNGRLQWGKVNMARARNIIMETAAEAAESTLEANFGRDALALQIVQVAAKEMCFLVEALVTMGKRLGFEQVAAEYSFGHGHSPVVLGGGSEVELTLRGKVDRIDRMIDSPGKTGRNVCILFDFKSGARDMKAARLDEAVDVQLAVYALALNEDARPLLSKIAPENESMNASVLGFFYWPMKIGFGQAGAEPVEEPGSKIWFDTHRAAGLFDEAIVGALDTDVGPGDKSLAFNFALTKGGELNKRSFSGLASDQFANYLGHVEDLLESRARDIIAGNIPVSPLAESSNLVCDHCAFEPVCRVRSCDSSVQHDLPSISAKQFREKFANATGENA